jgi:hypothetical protein
MTVSSKDFEKLFAEHAPLLSIFLETIQHGFWQSETESGWNFLPLSTEDRLILALGPSTPDTLKKRRVGYRAFAKSGTSDISS